MPDKYQVFVDNLSGFTWLPALGADTLEEVVQAIHGQSIRQHWMYYIYVLHQERVPYWGARTDVYKHVKAVAGSLVEPIYIRHKGGLEYALTTWESGWLFCDNLF